MFCDARLKCELNSMFDRIDVQRIATKRRTNFIVVSINSFESTTIYSFANESNFVVILITSFRFVFYNWNTTRYTNELFMYHAMHQLCIWRFIVRVVVHVRCCIWLHQFATFRTIIFVVAMRALRMIETNIATRICVFTHCFVRRRIVRFDDFTNNNVCVVFRFVCNVWFRRHLNHIISFRFLNTYRFDMQCVAHTMFLCMRHTTNQNEWCVIYNM